MSEVDDLLARVEREHGPEVAAVVKRSIEAGPPKRKGRRRIYGGQPDPRRTGHALGGGVAGGARHSGGYTGSVAVRDMPSR